MAVTVLYEDSLNPGQARFVPHLVVLGCMADTRSIAVADWWPFVSDMALEAVAQPKNGIYALVQVLRVEYANLSANGPVIAVVDSDRICSALQLAHDTPAEEVQAALRDGRSNVHPILLDKNMESVVAAAAAILRIRVPEQKSLSTRDGVLGKLLIPDRVEERRALVEQHPSVRELVDTLDGLLP